MLRLQGTRKRIPPHLLRLPEIGITLISPDYRLAPQADIYSILEDANSAVEYVRTDLPRLLNIDPRRLALTGGSAGGWLALLAGIPCHMTGSLSSPPTCIAALYPMVDVHTPFYTNPQQPLPWMNDLIPYSAIATDIDPTGPVITSSTKQDTRALVCDYVTQEGTWHELWTVNSTKDYERNTFSITPRIDRANGCPPIWITTGLLDQCIDPTGVPNLVRLMRENGMEVGLEERKGVGHSFDFEMDERVEGLRDFLIKHLF